MSKLFNASWPLRMALTVGLTACCVSCGGLNERHKVVPFVPQREVQSSTDTFAGPPEVKAYDREFVSSVRNRWYDLLDGRAYSHGEPCKVVVAFKLHSDGRISDMEVVEQNVDVSLVLLCEKAVLDLSPFQKWPDEMRGWVNKDYRPIRFTFTTTP